MSKLSDRLAPFVPLIILGLFLLLVISILRTSLFGNVEDGARLFFEISFLLLLAMGAELAVVYLKQPTVVLLLIVGILVSQSFVESVWPAITNYLLFLPKTVPHFITDISLVQALGQLGAIFILLEVGLHVKLGKIFNLENAAVAFMGVIIPFAAGYIYSIVSGGSVIYGMFLGAALVATSVGVTVALLKEFKVLNSRFAEVILGAAVLDDVLGLLVLSFVSAFAAEGGAGFEAIVPIIFNSAVFLAGGVLAGNYFLKNYIDRYEFDSKTVLVVLSFAFLYSYIAEFIGLSSIVGAFLAGIILNQSRHLASIDERTEAIGLIFAPIFFISLGMLVDVSAFGQFIVPILVITVIAIISKAGGGLVGGLAIRLNFLESAIVGVGMVPRGEVALIVGLIGLTKGVLDSGQYTVIASMAFLTAIVMPFMLQPLLRRVKK